MLTILMFVCQLSHLRFPQCHGDAIDANFDTCSKALGLEVILRAKFPGAFGDY